MIRLHEYSSLIHQRFAISDFPFSICSRNAFAFSCDRCIAARIAFRNCDSFACRGAATRSAFQKFEGALDWTSSDGRPGIRYHD
jgi:uroporphyrinogen-III synthase